MTGNELTYIVEVYIGARDETAAQRLWESLPAVYRQYAVAYTDFWQAYAKVLPTKRHQAVVNSSPTQRGAGMS